LSLRPQTVPDAAAPWALGLRRADRGRFRPSLPPAPALRSAVGALGLVVVCLGVGAAVAHASLVSLVLAAAVAGIGVSLVFAELRLRVLVVWIVVAPLAYPFLRWPAEESLLTFDRIWLGALLGLVLLAQRTARPGRPSRLLGAALLWLVVSYGVRAATSPSVLPSLETWVDGILLPALLFAAVRECASSERDCRRLFGALAAGGLVLAAIGLAERAWGFELASRSGGVPRFDPSIGLVRISGPYDVPEPYALALLACLAGTLAWTQLRSGGARWVGTAIVVAELAAIGFTFFRAAWIGALVIVALGLGLRPRQALRAIAVCALLACVALAGALAFGNNQTVSTRVGDTANVYARFATYEQGIEIFREAPLVGVGVGEFSRAQVGRATRAVEGVDGLDHPHSSFVALLAEQGIVGFLPLVALTIFAGLLLRRFRGAARSRCDVLLAAAALGGAFAYLAMSASLTMLPYGPSNAFVAVLMGMAAARLDSSAGPGPSGDDADP
jgi:O-antigen ligase/polysaccharide polymerase Wzy-like membrane protein